MARRPAAPPLPRWTTLDAFLVPAPSTATTYEPPACRSTRRDPTPPPPTTTTRRPPFCAALAPPCPHARAAGARAAAASLAPAGAAPAGGGGPVVGARFDEGGELLAVALGGAPSTARVHLHSDASVRRLLADGGGGRAATLDAPLLSLTPGAAPAAVAWSGDAWLAVLRAPTATVGGSLGATASFSTAQLACYAVDVSPGGAAPPTRAFAASLATAAPGSAVPPPLTALAPTPPAPALLAAADARGHGHLFDVRARGPHAVALFRPASTRHGARAARAAVLGGGTVLAAAADAGDVVLWDVRGGRTSSPPSVAALGAPSSSLLASAAAPPLAVLHLPSLVAGVPGLAPSPVDLGGGGGADSQSLLPPDPADAGLGPPAALEACPRHRVSLAFQTGCGWTGAIDVARGVITHVHAPPALHPAHARAASHGGWGGGSGVFVAPGAGGGLVAVDVSGHASAAVVPTDEDDGDDALPAATLVPLPPSLASSHATCVAVSPASGEVVAGTGCGRVVAYWGAV